VSDDVRPNGPLEFAPHAAAEIPGQRVESKVCELCSKNFFRDASKPIAERDKECKPCAAKLSAPKELIPRAGWAEEDYAKQLEARRAKRLNAGLTFGPKSEDGRRRCGNFTRGAERKGGGNKMSREKRDAAVREMMRKQIAVVQ
jgi:hypothetical protein